MMTKMTSVFGQNHTNLSPAVWTEEILQSASAFQTFFLHSTKGQPHNYQQQIRGGTEVLIEQRLITPSHLL